MRRLLWLAVLIVVAFLGFAVWPTPYRYIHVANYLVRVNRITGSPSYLTDIGWSELAAPQPSPLYDEWKRSQPAGMDTAGMKMDTTAAGSRAHTPLDSITVAERAGTTKTRTNTSKQSH